METVLEEFFVVLPFAHTALETVLLSKPDVQI